jgi:tryptophanase/2-polyprenyl-6-methoxyphenol hydroxylase-like FAD-dependent oxidoreductase
MDPRDASLLAEPFRIKVIEHVRVPDREERLRKLKEAFWSIVYLKSEDVYIDLVTDSGTGAMSDAQWAGLMRGDEAYFNSRSFAHLEESVREVMGYRHIIPTHQGRAAENLMMEALVPADSIVLSNTHFDTTRAHVLNRQATPLDLVGDWLWDINAKGPFQGNFDLNKLRVALERYHKRVPFILITVLNNLACSSPVSMENIRAVKALADQYKIPIYFDACRFAENAYFIQQREPGYSGKSIAAIVHEMFSYGVGCWMSAKKDALVNIGGFIAVNDEELAARCQQRLVLYEGFTTYGGLARRDLEAMAVGLREGIGEEYLAHRVGQTEYLGKLFSEAGVAVHGPVGGSGVFVDTASIYPHLPPDRLPGIALANDLYLQGAIRAGAAPFHMHTVDVQGNIIERVFQVARFAIPRRVYTKSHMDYVGAVMRRVVANAHRNEGYRLVYAPKMLAHFFSKFEPVGAPAREFVITQETRAAAKTPSATNGSTTNGHSLSGKAATTSVSSTADSGGYGMSAVTQSAAQHNSSWAPKPSSSGDVMGNPVQEKQNGTSTPRPRNAKRDSNSFDVAILGTGLTGTILGAILAKNGVKTLLIEQSVHPRFAIGESTVPETTFQFRILAQRYGVPEIANLSTFSRVRRTIGTTCGVKRNFSFVFHRPGEPQRPKETCQLPTLSPPMGPDVHLFRQDVDTYLLSVAASYGAVIRQRTDIKDIRIEGNGVTLRTGDGTTFEADYVVDAGGIKAPVAHALGLRHEVPDMMTHSRSLYTHMLNVVPFDACMAGREEHDLPSPLSQGTLHHLFDGGWMWVIPFYNHRSSTNRLCSVGLNLDPRKHPPTGLPPDEEFRRFVARFPALKKQFADAVAIRDWVSTDRLQFSSSQIVGDRFCLMPHAAAFVDPLFSSGLGISMNAINALSSRLIAAKQDQDYSGDRFKVVEQRTLHNFKYFDRLVARSYHAFSDFEVWNSWYKVWLLAGMYGAAGQLDVLGQYYRTGSQSAFDLCEQVPYNYIQASEMPLYRPVFAAATKEMDAFGQGQQGATDTADRLYDIVAKSTMWPGPWGSTRRRHPESFTVPNLVPLIAWFKRGAPEYLREHYFNKFQIQDVLRMTATDFSAELQQSTGMFGTLSRDFARGYNYDWKRFVPDAT